MDNNTAFVLTFLGMVSVLIIPIVLRGVENIVRAWREGK